MQRFRSYAPAGVLLPLFVLALATLGAAGVSTASADTPTPSPGPIPAGSGNVHVRNTLDGEPFIDTVALLGQALVGGQTCILFLTTVSIETIVQSTYWPWDDEPPCNQPGASSRMCHSVALHICSDEFIFTGDDVTVDVELGPHTPDAVPIVRFRFVHDGSAQPVTLLSWSFKSGGGKHCTVGSTDPTIVSTVVTGWIGPTGGPRGVCATVGQEVDVRFKTEEFGELEGSFTWLGEDVTVAIDTGAFLSTPTASPSVSPSPTTAATDTPSPTGTTPTPAGLPETGGQPGSSTRADTVALVVIGALTAVTAAAAAARRRR